MSLRIGIESGNGIGKNYTCVSVARKSLGIGWPSTSRIDSSVKIGVGGIRVMRRYITMS